MIEIKDKGEEVTADDGMNEYHFPTWDELWGYIDKIKKYPDEKIFIREGCKLTRIKI